MTRLTKDQLVQQLEASHVAYEKLAARLASLEAQPAAKPAAVAARTYVPKADISCPKCSGTGAYGGDGICFQCEGKGTQNDADQRRNWGYGKFISRHVQQAPSAVKPAYVPPAPTADQIAYRERMAAAKAAAMATGKAVLV